MTGIAGPVADALGPDVRDLFPGVPAAERVVAPTTVDALSEALAAASRERLRVLVWGGGEHQGIGYPVEADVVLVTSGLQRVVDWQPEDLTIVVEAGMAVAQLATLLDERGQSAVLPETPGNATVGGVVAAAASGWRRLGYGPTRDRVLEVVLITGDGRVVTGGGRVVKNVTGYDIPRLATGSLGALGVIASVCLKLWPTPTHTATIDVPDAAHALAAAYRPLAVVETNHVSRVFVAGTAEELTGQAADLRSTAMPGLRWPEPLDRRYIFSLRVPAPEVAAAVERLHRITADLDYQAAHGVGEVKLGLDDMPLAALTDLRAWAEELGGALVTLAAPAGTGTVFDPWGTPPATVDIQRRLKRSFDPAGVLNTGRLPGRI